MITRLDFVALATRDSERAPARWGRVAIGWPFVAQNNRQIALHVSDFEAIRRELESKVAEFLGEVFDTRAIRR